MNRYDYTFLRMIMNIAIKKQKEEHDTCFLVCGKEGKGKSTVCIHALKEFGIIKNEPISVDDIAFSLGEFINLLYRKDKGSMVILDEASELASDRHMENMSKATRQMFTVMRAKALITFICFTNPLKINTYFREDRVKGVLYVKRRGLVYYYNQNTVIHQVLPFIKRLDTKSIDVFARFRPDAIFDYPVYDGVLWKEYTYRKMENIDRVLGELSDTYGRKEKVYSLTKAAAFLHVAMRTLKQYVESGELIGTKSLTGSQTYIKENDLLKFREDFAKNLKTQNDQKV